MHRNALMFIADFFFPPHEDIVLVRDLSEEVLREKLILQNKPEPWIVTGFSYRDHVIRALIRANKFHANKKAASLLGVCLADIILSSLEESALSTEWREPLLIPIPSSSSRARSRGYNQVERIVEYALPFIGTSVSYHPHLLKRKERVSQIRVERKNRTKNVQRAFFVDAKRKSEIEGAYCILVDDVSETGATLHDARRALLEAGAREVVGVAVSH